MSRVVQNIAPLGRNRATQLQVDQPDTVQGSGREKRSVDCERQGRAGAGAAVDVAAGGVHRGGERHGVVAGHLGERAEVVEVDAFLVRAADAVARNQRADISGRYSPISTWMITREAPKQARANVN